MDYTKVKELFADRQTDRQHMVMKEERLLGSDEGERDSRLLDPRQKWIIDQRGGFWQIMQCFWS